MEEKILDFLTEALRNRFGNSFQIMQTEPVGGGCISHARKLKTSHGTYFLKWNASCPVDLFVREAECLNALRENVADRLLIPEVLLATENGSLPGFILMEYLEPGSVPKQDEKLGYGLAHLHREAGDKFGFSHNNFCGLTPQQNDWTDNWPAFFAENRLDYLLRLIRDSRGISSTDLKVYEMLMGKLSQLLPLRSVPVLIHGDLWSGNYLYTSRGPALIDPASYYADREMELSIMTLFGGFSNRTWQAYQESCPLENGWEERVQVYQLYHILNHFLLFGGHYGQQALLIAKKFI